MLGVLDAEALLLDEQRNDAGEALLDEVRGAMLALVEVATVQALGAVSSVELVVVVVVAKVLALVVVVAVGELAPWQ